MSERVLCKDCKHSFKPLSDWIFADSYSLRCKLAHVEEKIVDDPVTGPKKEPAYYERCTNARYEWLRNKDNCGPDGKFWQPKNKKGLFKLIKHVSTE
jgi:hypothetical protein